MKCLTWNNNETHDTHVSMSQLIEILQPPLKGVSSSNGASTGTAVFSLFDPSKTSWLLDSGASFDMTRNHNILSERHINSSISNVFMADGSSLEIKGIENFENTFWNSKRFIIPKVRYIPKLNLNLLLVFQISYHGCNVSFSSSGCWVQDRQSRKLIGESHRK